ncbi:MAG TPA: uL15m family ribosomal protein [Candidatus Bathyarchaeia archaeon]|nr:uL15m family ribosomal protein [Candidatus Bathyarchaeia archaeon]
MATVLNRLPKITAKSKKRLGRGYGSGKGGHTVGRGAKGDKARGKTGLLFQGTKAKKSYVRRLPLRRGKGRFKPLKPRPLVLNVRVLNLLPEESLVTAEFLVKQGIVHQQEIIGSGVKILGGGEIGIPLTVALPCSLSARKKIEKAGGKVVDSKVASGKKEVSNE